ncbi:1-phosphatidylinositol 4,5-bisphosphate phosphodiesterase delta-4 [Aphanomyces cochlioides]|nr:1-phosphatidylinositol 4,5-bisphosphate phosphodiesterase delta-4 [Aphanomyces cochlioides]
MEAPTDEKGSDEIMPAPISIKGTKGQLFKEKSKKLKCCVQYPSDEPLLKGEVLKKVSRGGQTATRKFFVTPDLFCLKWEATGKLSMLKDKIRRNPNTIDLASIVRLQSGVTTAKLHRMDSKTSLARGRCFSIILAFGKTIDFICSDDEQYDRWYNGLLSLVNRLRTARLQDPEKAFLYQMWIHADVNHDGMLSRSEVEKVTHTLNHALKSKPDLRRMFSDSDMDHDGELDFDEYCNLMIQLRHRPELDTLFDPRANGNSFLTSEAFSAFLTWNGHSSDEIQTILESFTVDDQCTRPLFRRYIASSWNSWAKPAMLALHQDMTMPISHYFIASSHNTYLEGDQLQSNSSVNMYISALLRSCRCVEIDCWDGDDGQPIVYHGRTLTTKIKFFDVIKAIQANAFVTSPYPVVISLENHCSEAQQVIMVDMMVLTFGDQLHIQDPENDVLPSPESLKYKFLLKGKQGAKVDEKAGDSESDEDDEGKDNDNTSKKSEEIKRRPSQAVPVKKKSSVAPELAAICFFKGVHFHDFEASKSWQCNQMSSFSESKTKKLATDQKFAFVELNRKHVSRIYPSGMRVDSSNYNPLLGWSTGSQLVALNYQTSDLPMRLNHGMFSQNGNCGYVLKPPSMLSEIGTYRRAIQSVTVQVFSGQQLPKPQGEKKGEIIDPYVLLDLVSDGNSIQKKSQTIQDNGLNPNWNFEAKLDVGLESACHILVLTVMDYDLDRDDLIGFAALPLTCIREGYRTVPLHAGDGSRTGPYEFASLFCHFSFEELHEDEDKA